MECEILGKVCACCGLARTTLEVSDGDHLQVLVRGPYRQIGSRLRARISSCKQTSQTIDLGKRIEALARVCRFRQRPLPCQRALPEIGV